MHEWKEEVKKRLRRLRLRSEREVEIIEEICSHLQDRYDELRSQGATHKEAIHDVMSELDFTDLAPELRASQETLPRDPVPEGATATGRFFWDFAQDLRYAARMLSKSPGFTAVAALTLALGIGANTAVFTMINTLILNPMAIDRASQLVAVNTSQTKKTPQSGEFQPVSFLNLKDLRERTHSFQNLAGYSYPMALTMTDGAEPHRVFMELVTANYFDTLSIHPFMGRFFLPSEDVTPGDAAVVVLGYAAWQGRFGGSTDVLGRTIKLNNTPFTIIGIGPKGFKGVDAVFGPDMWIPSMMARQVLPVQQQSALNDRAMPLFTGAGHLEVGKTLIQAQAELRTVADALAKEYPDANQGQSVTLRPLTEAAFGTNGRQPAILGGALLMAIVAFVLLIACSNVANLLLARASLRRHEIAVRMTLGAGRWRLIRQLLTESVLLSVVGGGFGFVLGWVSCRFLWSFRPAEFAQNLAELRLNGSVFVFTVVVAILTGLTFGIMPALRSSDMSVSEALKEETPAGRSRGQVSLANALLAGQVSLSLVLLVVAALFLRSIQHEYTIDPGFQTKNLAIFMLYPGQTGYDQIRTEQFYKQVRRRLADVPGILSVSWASNMPFWARKDTGITIEGQGQRKKSEAISAVINTVDLDYFSTLSIPFVEGRDFTEDDRDNSSQVAIINNTMAAEYWPNKDALSERLRLHRGNDLLQIVGVVKTTNYQTIGEPPQAAIYLPLRQHYSGDMILYVRTERDPAKILTAVQSEIRNLDPGLPVEDMRTGTKVVDQALWSSKMGVGLLTVFGLLALALASVGLYGIMAHSVNRRRREIGVRMALGAGPGTVSLLVLRQGLALVSTGAALGVVLALLVGRALSSFLYGVSGADPLSIGGAAVVLIVVGFAACYLPARSASRLDPLVALRER